MKKMFLFLVTVLIVYSCNNDDDDNKDFQPTCIETYMRWSVNDKNLAFPNTFTPNGDARNDLLRVIGATEDVSAFEMSVLNSKGTQVFMTTDINTAWNGIYNATVQPAGSYSVKLKITFAGETKEFDQCVYLAEHTGVCVDLPLADYYFFEDQFDNTTCIPIYTTNENLCP